MINVKSINRYLGHKILVTGGTGFIGGRLAERLAVEEGAQVRVLVHNWTKAAWVSRANVELLQGNMTSENEMSLATEGVELVFHCANGIPEDNVSGLKTLINCCINHKIRRLVFFSTIGVLGNNFHEGINESAPYRSIGNAYAESKIQCEKMLKTVDLQKVEWCILRPTYVWGPNSVYFTMEPVMEMIKEDFYLVNQGNGACNAVYVDNVIDLAFIAGIHTKAIGETFNISDGKRLAWKEFFNGYAKMIGKSINDCKNVIYPIPRAKQIVFSIVTHFETINNYLTKLIYWIEDKSSPLAFLMKVPRKVISYLIKALKVIAANPYNTWDLVKFSQKGFLDLSKSEQILEYRPNTSLSQGMENCCVFLYNQNIIRPDL